MVPSPLPTGGHAASALVSPSTRRHLSSGSRSQPVARVPGLDTSRSPGGKARSDQAARPRAFHDDHGAWSPPRGAPQLPYQPAILARIRPLLVGHAADPATAQPPPTTTAKSPPTPPLVQHGLHRPRSPGSDSGKRRAGRGPRRATTPAPAIPATRLPAPPPASTTSRSDTADAGTHGHRTPHWTTEPDTWTLRRPHRTLDTRSLGPCPLAPDTGRSHRTLDTGRARTG